MDSAANPETEHKRLEFWIACVKKFGDQLRSLSLYDEKKNNFNSQKNSFFETPYQNRQGGANLKLRCFTCSNHHMTKNGTPSQYLALCSYFRDQNLHKQKELLKFFKMCAICLNPKSKCRKDPRDKSSPCQLQVKFNLKCKCGDTTHHSLMCPHPKSENSYYQSNNDYQQSGSQRGGRGGSQRGRGARGGRGRGREGRHQNDRRSQQYQPKQGRQDSSSFNTNQFECPSTSNNNCNSAQPSQRPTQGQKSHNTQLNQQPQMVGQEKKQITFENVTDSNFMSPQNPELIRQKFNIPDDVRVNSYFVGNGEDDVVNAFSSQESPQNLKQHILCVSKVKVRLPSRCILETSALLETGSILNFGSKTLIEKMGSPKQDGIWCGSIKTVSGIKTISTPFFELALKDVHNNLHHQMLTN